MLARPAEPLPDSSFARTREDRRGNGPERLSSPGPSSSIMACLGSASSFAVNDDRRERSAGLRRRRDERTEKTTFARAYGGGQRAVGTGGRGGGGTGSRHDIPCNGHGCPGQRGEPDGQSSAERPERARAGSRPHRAEHPGRGRERPGGYAALLAEGRHHG